MAFAATTDSHCRRSNCFVQNKKNWGAAMRYFLLENKQLKWRHVLAITMEPAAKKPRTKRVCAVAVCPKPTRHHLPLISKGHEDHEEVAELDTKSGQSQREECLHLLLPHYFRRLHAGLYLTLISPEEAEAHCCSISIADETPWTALNWACLFQ